MIRALQQRCSIMAIHDNFLLLLLPSAQLCPILCDPMNCNPPDSSVHGISQSKILEWVAISFSRDSSWPRDQSCVSCIAGRFFTTEPLWNILYQTEITIRRTLPTIGIGAEQERRLSLCFGHQFWPDMEATVGGLPLHESGNQGHKVTFRVKLSIVKSTDNGCD